MAGGWPSITDEDGRYYGAGSMDTGGDVEEFSHDVFGMMWWLAAQLAGQEIRDEDSPEFRAAALRWITVACEPRHTREGAALGGTSPERM
jgi:hypothetical protein